LLLSSSWLVLSVLEMQVSPYICTYENRPFVKHTTSIFRAESQPIKKYPERWQCPIYPVLLSTALSGRVQNKNCLSSWDLICCVLICLYFELYFWTIMNLFYVSFIEHGGLYGTGMNRNEIYPAAKRVE
jgi:hypothetical protein